MFVKPYKNTLCSEGQCAFSGIFYSHNTYTARDFSARISFQDKNSKTKHESTDQQLLRKEKITPWHSRDVLNEMIRVAQA